MAEPGKPAPSLVLDPGSAVKAVGGLWGFRKDSQRTNGTEALSEAYVALHVWADAFDIPELKLLAAEMAAAKAGEGGWDAEAMTGAIAATVPRVSMPPPDGKRGGGDE